MTERMTEYGRLLVGPVSELFAQAVALAAHQHARSTAPAFTWAFSGGETPQAWYRWCSEQRSIPASLLASAHFTVSDERHVPFDSPQSNFGNADRLLLAPLRIPADRRHPWLVDRPPVQSAEAYIATMESLVGKKRGYDVCMLGLGDDDHTASFFPGSPLLQNDDGALFAAVLTVEKGWRLTITPAGLRACGQIVVMTMGAGKAEAMRRVFRDNYDPIATPAQILKTCAERVVWLIDEAAAAKIA